MAGLIHIKKVVIGPKVLDATIQLSDDAPLMTSDDALGTRRVVDLIPGVEKHVCLGDAAPQFGDVVRDTEVAHLLEHVTVELLALTNRAGDIASGRTTTLDNSLRLFEVSLACPDDVLVAGALSSAAWILDWAYAGGEDPKPNVDAIVQGLVALVKSVDGEDELEDAPESASEDTLEDAPEEASQHEGASDGSYAEKDDVAEVAEEFVEKGLAEEADYEASGAYEYEADGSDDSVSYREGHDTSAGASFYDDQYARDASEDDDYVEDDWYDDQQSDGGAPAETHEPYVEEDEDAGTADVADAAASDAEEDKASVDESDAHERNSFDDDLPDDWSMINVPRPRPVR